MGFAGRFLGLCVSIAVFLSSKTVVVSFFLYLAGAVVSLAL